MNFESNVKIASIESYQDDCVILLEMCTELKITLSCPRSHFWDPSQLGLWSPDFPLWFSIESPDSRVWAGQGLRNVSWGCLSVACLGWYGSRKLACIALLLLKSQNETKMKNKNKTNIKKKIFRYSFSLFIFNYNLIYF